jgi:BMFP domain-containing protein YqiC
VYLSNALPIRTPLSRTYAKSCIIASQGKFFTLNFLRCVGLSHRYRANQEVCTNTERIDPWDWTHRTTVRYPLPMIEKLNIEALSKSLAGSVPPTLISVGTDLEKTFRAALQSTLERMNLVSREEFEVQKQVLAKTRQKLEALEAIVADLERRIIGE